MKRSYDAIVIGAGAAGMMCAARAAQRGRHVLIIDHATSLAEKIRISGGGRCNFTNRVVGASHFLSQNPHFCRSALARYGSQHFVALVERHGIRYHEKTLGQLFCDDSSQQIIDMLVQECADGQVDWAMPAKVESVGRADNDRFRVQTDHGDFDAAALVVATGGLSIPKIGATDLGYRIATQFDLPIVTPRPALVPLTLDSETLAALAPLAGAAFDVVASCGDGEFRERALITHRGLSGPAILQISSYWQYVCASGHPAPVRLDLLPDEDAASWLAAHGDSNALLGNLLGEILPKRFAKAWCELHGWERPLKQIGVKERKAIAEALGAWSLSPSGTQGYSKAEVTLGGVDTRALSSKTMAALKQPGLYFIGEVVDVTGHLGGYNFQWAWSSAVAAGDAV
ncbi:MAG TPA: NAD(P)/FAD-dependent oxidoreductase [Denitromonas sp.]|nr:NAD(P)/FAD-dependent oxidoreductase [Denitromonas sp.]HQU87183.1 NAD(P)/FAD-dependent oxidoreductase [Denitromonas sp.]HQV13303.1 NAD(P)/FAD-dependent oxidoreductase [Denitromonas sp.]